MRSRYDAPPRPAPVFDYKKHRDAAYDHMQTIIHKGYHNGQAQHLGGVASLADHLDSMYHGPATFIKKELKDAIDYLYYYASTGHEIYKWMADDKIMHIGQLCEEITDPQERAHVYYFIEAVKEYMQHLSNGSAHSDTATQTRTPTYNGGGVNL